MRTAYFLTHPIQYQSPLIRAIAVAGQDLTVVYASTQGVQGYHDPDFGVQITWDVPLLEGYKHESLGLEDVGGSFFAKLSKYRNVIRQWLQTHPVDVVWIHGWGHPFNLAALIEGQRANPRVRVMLRGEAHLDCLRGKGLRQIAHRWLLMKLFRGVDRFLAVGTANREFYLAYGVPAERITLMPYVVDNDFFRKHCESSREATGGLRTTLALDPRRPVVLYSGKLISIKSVDTIIRGLHLSSQGQQADERPYLVVVGDGELRSKLEALADELLPGDVRFVGFQPQRALPAWYALADVFVLPSTFEPWGLVVNEAMNAGKPVIVSDKVGSRLDLVKTGVNGDVFPSGDAELLAKVISPLLRDPAKRRQAGEASLRMISSWGIPETVAGFENALLQLAALGPPGK